MQMFLFHPFHSINIHLSSLSLLKVYSTKRKNQLYSIFFLLQIFFCIPNIECEFLQKKCKISLIWEFVLTPVRIAGTIRGRDVSRAQHCLLCLVLLHILRHSSHLPGAVGGVCTCRVPAHEDSQTEEGVWCHHSENALHYHLCSRCY